MAVAVVALILALGGTAMAKFGPFKGDKIIKKHSLSGNRLKNIGQIGKVNSAKNADSAKTAGFANAANVAGVAQNSNALGGLAAAAYAQTTQQSYIAPTFGAGVGNFGAPFTAAGYMKDNFGFVHLKGFVGCGSTSSTVLFTLPDAYQPSEVHFYLNQPGGGSLQVLSNNAGFPPEARGEVVASCATGSALLDDIVFPAHGTAGTAAQGHGGSLAAAKNPPGIKK
jgi:hypothetical protein